MHKPIQIKNLSLFFPDKTCFTDFNTTIYYGSKIAIIGRNGVGKSALLKILMGLLEPTYGEIQYASDVTFGYVPQIIGKFETLSGGERFNEALNEALSHNPNILVLDEPTNHLDLTNRKSLMKRLAHFDGTLIVVSHDTKFLRSSVNILWHIDNEEIKIFSGNYDDYINEISLKSESIKQEIASLNMQKKQMHKSLMQEQKRAAKSKAKGQKSIDQRKWPSIVSKTKALNAQETSGKKKTAIDQKKQDLSKRLAEIAMPKVIVPKFSLSASSQGGRALVTITGGSVAYKGNSPILQEISFSIYPTDRIALTGDNGSGKTTFIKAILGDPQVIKGGSWNILAAQEMGYLDQHYSLLNPNKTVLEEIRDADLSKMEPEIRRHLSDFLFHSNEEVNKLISNLSGGEKARLSLAQIALKTPRLLILDEITNNIDLETRNHVIEVLKYYPGAMIVISHDEDFLKEIDIDSYYFLQSGQMRG